MVFAYITCKDKKEAKKISKYLLDKKLIACANVFDIDSYFRWKGEFQEDKESVMLAKTTKDKFHEIIKEVESIHSYELPCISLIESESNKEFGNWVREEIK